MSMIINLLPYLVGLCAAATLLVLFAGLFTMAASVSAHDKYGNMLMRWRVSLQAATVALLGLLVALKSLT